MSKENGDTNTADRKKSKDKDNEKLMTEKMTTKYEILTNNIQEENSEDKGDMDEDGDTDDDDLKTVKITSFEELMEVVGTSGRWNLIIIVACAFSCLLTPFSSISYQFLGATPDYWCQIPVLQEANWTQQQIINFAIPLSSSGTLDGCHMFNYNYTRASILGYNISMTNIDTLKYDNELIACKSRAYNHTQYQSSVVIEWDLTCESRALYSTTQSATQLGTLLGSVFYGHILHTLGRRKGILLSCMLAILIGILTIASPNIHTFIFLRFLFQAVDIGYYMGCFLTAMEMCSVKQRTYVGSLFLLPWALGYMMVPGIAYIIRPWRYLQLAFVLPLFSTLMYYWILPESPRWLIMRGEYDAALKVLMNGAAVNKRKLPPPSYIIEAMHNIKHKEDKCTSSQESISKGSNIKERLMIGVRYMFMLILTREVRVKILVVLNLWCITSMIYYGVSLNGYNLSTNMYIYTFLGGVVEVPSYLLLWLCVSILGRRKTLVLLYFISGTSIVALAAIMYTSPQVSMIVKILLSLSGKMSITAAFQLIWFYTIELFSTKYRARAVGEASMFCRIGSAASPYINDILGEYVVWGPCAVFGPAALVAMALIFMLPEMANKNMTQNDDKITLTEQIDMCT